MGYNKSKAAAYFQKKKEAGQELMEIACKRCGNPTTFKKYRLATVKKNGKVCESCVKKQASSRLKTLRGTQSPEQRTQHAKEARACMNDMMSEVVRKQWKTIKADPDKISAVSKRRSRVSKENWDKRPKGEQERIIKAMLAAGSGARSKLSDQFKQSLIDSGLYDGFVSEECFHGFFPDEINHELKVIVEVYGDVYHCNPLRYSNPDEFVSLIKRTVAEQHKRDERRIACFKRRGYDVVIVWEANIRSQLDIEIERVRSAINASKSR